MTKNFDELYSGLSQRAEFNEAFADKEQFQKYLESDPEADSSMKDFFGVDNATSFLKKKEQKDVSISNSPSVGNEVSPEMGVPQETQPVESTGASDQGIDLTGNPLPNLYGKSIPTPILDPVKTQWYNSQLSSIKTKMDAGKLDAVRDLQILSQSPDFQEYKTSKDLGKVIKELNSSFSSNIYNKYKGSFSDPKMQNMLKQAGIEITSATGFTPEKLKVQPKSILMPKGPVEKTEKEKVFEDYLKFSNNPDAVGNVATEEEQNKKLDDILNKDAERLIAESRWAMPTASDKNPENSLLFKNDDGIVEVNPIAIGKKVESYLNLSMNQVPEALKPIVEQRLTRLFTQQAENKLIGGEAEKVFQTKLKAAGIDEAKIKQLPRNFENEMLIIGNQTNKTLESYKGGLVAEANKNISEIEQSRMDELNNLANTIKSKLDNNQYTSKEQYDAEYVAYIEKVSEAVGQVADFKQRTREDAEKLLKQKKLEIEKESQTQVQELYKKYHAEKKGDKIVFQDFDKLQSLYNESYNQVNQSREEQRKIAQSWDYKIAAEGGNIGSALVGWAGDRLQAAASRAFENSINAVTASVGYENNPLTGALKYLNYVEANNKKSGLTFADSEGFMQSLESATSSILDQVANLSVGIAAGVLTKNPWIAGSISWAQDTVDQVGQNYNDSFEKFGSHTKAKSAAVETLGVQSLMYPAYAIQFLPFTDKFLSTAKGISTKAVMQDIAKFVGVEYVPELFTELVQNYKNAQFVGDERYKDASFLDYAKAEGPKLAIEILPSVGVMSGAGIVTARAESIESVKRVDALKQFLGKRGLSQTVADAIDVMGPKSAMIIPEYLLNTGQINKEQFQEMSKSMGDLIATYPTAKGLIQDKNKARYYVDLMGQQKAIEEQMATLPEGNPMIPFLENKVKNVKKTMQDIVDGKDTNFTVISGKNGFSYVTDDRTATNLLNTPNFAAALENGDIEITTKDENLNKMVEEKKKLTEERKGKKEVSQWESGTNLNAATVKEEENLNNVLNSSARARVDLDNRVTEAKNAQQVLDKLMPGVNVVLHTAESYNDKMQSVKGKSTSAGNFSYVRNEDGTYSVEIQINLDTADEKTIAHEVTHAILLKEFGENAEAFSNFKDQLSGLISDSDNTQLQNFINRYGEFEKSEEFLAELGAILTARGSTIDPGILARIAQLIQQFVSNLTGGNIVPFKNASEKVEIADFFNSLGNSLRTGEIQGKLKTNAVQEQTTSQVPVQPEANVGEEVAQGKPQTESQITPEEEKALEDAGNMDEGTQPLTDQPIEISPEVFNRASIGEEVTIPSDELMGGKQVNVGEVFSQFKEENGRNPKIWFWMADQLKRGEYINPKTGVTHFLEGGFNFANDPNNLENKEIWATGLDENLLNTRLKNADFIWLMSGSPNTSFNFSKGTSKVLLKEIEAGLQKNLGRTIEGVKINNGSFEEFVKIAEKMLPSNVKKWDGFLTAIKNPKMLDTSARKTFAETMLHEGGDKKITLPFQQFLHQELGVPTQKEFLPLLREKFLVDNDWKNGDMGILLKPNGEVKYNSGTHDTYNNSILGETVGFPTKKMNVKDILPKEALAVISKETGLAMEKPSEPAIIKTAVGDLGKIYEGGQLTVEDKGNIDQAINKSQLVRSEKSSGTTQVATTTGSYVKAANLIKDIQGDILDYGAGLGLGTDAMSNTLGRKVDSYEPNPERWQGKEGATYTASDQIGKKYDGIVSLNVLNVVPKDIRDAIVTDIFDKLNNGGKAIISTRKWSGDVNGAKNAVPGAEEKSLIITRKQGGKDVEVFQKGFDGNELVDYVQGLLGNQANVVKNASFGANGVIITKNAVQSKSQLNNGPQIQSDFQDDLNNNVSQKEALANLIKKGYLLSEIQGALGSTVMNETVRQQVMKDMAVESAQKLVDSKKDTYDEIETYLNQNYNTPLADNYAELVRQNYSPYEIFRVAQNMDIADAETLKDVFGADYRQTVENALDQEGISDDYIKELSDDTRTLKVVQRGEDLLNEIAKSGLGFVDVQVFVESLVDDMNKAGLLEAAASLRAALGNAATDQQLADGLKSFSKLASLGGTILQMARGLFQKKLGDMMIDGIERGGRVLTASQKQKIQTLAENFRKSNEAHENSLKELQADFSDENHNKTIEAKKQLLTDSRNLTKFLNDLKPTFWNERLSSGGSRALLGAQTVYLSIWANLEQNLYSTNIVNASTRRLWDDKKNSQLSGSLDPVNWLNAGYLSKDKSWQQMRDIFWYGSEADPAFVEKAYDSAAQINFFRDTKLFIDMITSPFSKIGGKPIGKMTDEEFADAFNQLLFKDKDGNIKLADGKAYTLARSAFWGILGVPSEFTGRLMAFGGDKAFANAAATRSMIDYFQNTKNSQYKGGLLEDFLADKDVSDPKTLSKLITLMDLIVDSDNPFEKEGLKRVFLGENKVSNVIGKGRGKLKKAYVAKYNAIKSGNAPGLTNLATLRGLQLLDLTAWTVTPFVKVPANVVLAANQKVNPASAIVMAINAKRNFDKAEDAFNRAYPKAIKQFVTEKQRLEYERKKMELMRLKRQMTYNFNAIEQSMIIAGFAISAYFAGAIIPPGDPGDEKEKLVAPSGVKTGTYNSTLHWEYLKALMSGEDTKNFIAKRGGFVREGDDVSNYANKGIMGFALGSWNNAMNAFNTKNTEGSAELGYSESSLMGFVFAELYTTGVSQQPFLQGFSRLAQVVTDESGVKVENWWSGTAATALSTFSPSLFSFMGKGNAETVQSINDINPTFEEKSLMTAALGRGWLKVVQKLNRNLSWASQNEYYKAMVGPLGEDLRYRTTNAQPGTLQAYAEALFNPFSERDYTREVVLPNEKITDLMLTSAAKIYERETLSQSWKIFDANGKYLRTEVKKGFGVAEYAQVQKKLYRQSVDLAVTMTNLLTVYKQMTNLDYSIQYEGQKKTIAQQLTNPQKNTFVFSKAGDMSVVEQPDQVRGRYQYNYSLPNDLWREELKIKGMYRAKSLEETYNGSQFGTEASSNVMTKVQNYLKLDDLQNAQKTLEDYFGLYETALTAADQSYNTDFVANRQTPYLKEMIRRGILKQADIEKLKQIEPDDFN